MAAPNPPFALARNQPLPPNPFHDTPVRDAYQYCLDSEAAAGDTDTVVYLRCLGYLLGELPSKAQSVLAHEILGCVAQGSKVDALGKFYVDHLIRLCMPFIISTRFRSPFR
jgi:hypothetical protein